MLRLVVVLALVLPVLLCTACAPPQKDPAVLAVEALFGALVRSDDARVLTLVGPRTRAALAAGADVASDAEPDTIADALAVRPGWSFTVDRTHTVRLADPADAAAPDARRVVAAFAGRTWTVPVVHIDGDWRVELLDAASHEVPSGG